jgi:putative membrane protein
MMGITRYGYGLLQGMPWYGWIGPIMMILFWALVVAAVILSIRYFVHEHRRRSRLDAPALEILKARYAKGEISKEEFEEKKKDIL